MDALLKFELLLVRLEELLTLCQHLPHACLFLELLLLETARVQDFGERSLLNFLGWCQLGLFEQCLPLGTLLLRDHAVPCRLLDLVDHAGPLGI